MISEFSAYMSEVRFYAELLRMYICVLLMAVGRQANAMVYLAAELTLMIPYLNNTTACLIFKKICCLPALLIVVSCDFIAELF